MRGKSATDKERKQKPEKQKQHTQNKERNKTELTQSKTRKQQKNKTEQTHTNNTHTKKSYQTTPSILYRARRSHAYKPRSEPTMHFILLVYHGQCHTAISNLALNTHNFAPCCNTVTSNLAINTYPSTRTRPLRSKPTMRCILLVIMPRMQNYNERVFAANFTSEIRQ